MMRYRRYRAFVVFAVFAVLALYQFGSRTPPVDYLKQQLNLRNHKADYSTAQKQEVLKDGSSSSPPAVVPKPAVVDVDEKKSGKTEAVGDDASVESKLAPPPVEEVEKPVQDAPPSAKGSEEKAKGDTKGVKGSTGSQSQKDGEGERIRVMPQPIPADAWQKVKPLLDSTEGRWESEQTPLYTEPIYWEKPEEHNPLADKDVINLPTGTPKKLPKVQAEFSKETVEQKKDRLAKQGVIKEAFLHAWGGYRAKAWGHDEVRPVSGNWKDPFNGWGATLVDSLDLIWMMGLTDEFEEAVAEVGKINFKTSPRPDIPLFETTIRYLGGLLGAYDVSGGKYKVLLDKAAELAEILIGAFDTPNRMPDTFYQWRPSATAKSHRSSTRVVLAELGSLAIEFTRLAQLTKEPRYYDAIARITDALDAWQDNTRVPGMWPSTLDASGCEKRFNSGASLTQITSNGALNLLDSNGKPLAKPEKEDYVSTGFAGSKGMTGKGAGTTTSNRDEDELEGVEVKHPLNPKEKAGTEIDDTARTKFEEGDDGVKVGRISGWDDIHNDEVSKPKLPPPKKQGAESEEFIPLQRPDPIAFKVDEANKKAKRQLRDSELSDELDPSKDPNGGVSAFAMHPDNAGTASDAAASIPENSNSKGSANTIPVGIPTHKHDYDDPIFSYVDTISEAECVPHGLQSQGVWGTDVFTLGSQADSTYEYLPKMFLMLNGLAPQYKRMYEKAIDAAKEHLLFRVMIPDEKREVLVSGDYSVTYNIGSDPTGKPTGKSMLRTTGSHLTCFVGGMFALGGKLFDRADDVQIAKKLTDGCVWAYEMTASGVMPETFQAVACEDRRECAWNESRWWAQLDPDLGAWRTKSYETSMEYYQQQMEYREKEIKEIRKQIKKHSESVSESSDEEVEAEVEAEDETKFKETDKHDPALLRSHSDMQKRQLKAADDDEDEPGKSKVKTGDEEEEHDEDYYIRAAHAQDEYEEQQIAKQLEIEKATPTSYEPESAWRQPTLTEEDLPPIYSPDKPPTHEQFVKTMIKEDRLPEGIQLMNDRRYILRPEALESVFYMHRITGSPYWRHAGWNMISSILKHTRTEFAHSAIDDVTKKHPKHLDSMESFWLAETLKYAWLLFEEEDKWSFDEWVYNTEAHPMRRLPGEGVPDGGVASKEKAAEEVEKKAKKTKSERLNTGKSAEDVQQESKKWES